MNRILLASLPLAGLVLLIAGILHGERPAEAAGPCGTTHDSLDGPEQEFLTLLASWRAVNVTFTTPLQVSGALNAAAAWFAQDIVVTGGFGEHTDSTGRSWYNRAADCGYDASFAAGSGEGIFVATSPNDPVVATPSTALNAMAGNFGSGIYIRVGADHPWPVKCVGVGHFRNANGTKEAWVTVLAQWPAEQACPGSTADPEPTATFTATATKSGTATPTSTPTKTATPTRTATGVPRYNAVLALVPGNWALVTLPPGPLADVLARAYGCYEVVYAFENGNWMRYSPDVPAYAQNFTTSTGGAVWIKASGSSCGLIHL
ncbi:MAG: hypothetical protein ACKVVT_18590 [Dehalococcoidia bacterium]